MLAVEGEVGLGVVVPGFWGRPGGGTSLLLRGTGLFWSEEKEAAKGEERVCEDMWGDSCGSEGRAGGESSVRSMTSGVDPAV